MSLRPPLRRRALLAAVLTLGVLAALPAFAQPSAPPAAVEGGDGATPPPRARALGGAAEAARDLSPDSSRELPRDLSPLGMFRAADPIVQAIMAGLLAASLATWAVGVAKLSELAGARRRARRALAALGPAESLAEGVGALRGRGAVVERLAGAAAIEIARSAGLPPEGAKERAATALARIEAGAARTAGRGIGLLAIVGSTAPFVGLLGTVWGIMNAFVGISRAATTNLAVVAPGIAEALLATAFGLLAAIPAVVIYNLAARGIAGYRALLADLSAAVLRLASRDLDRAASGAGGPPP